MGQDGKELHRQAVRGRCFLSFRSGRSRSAGCRPGCAADLLFLIGRAGAGAFTFSTLPAIFCDTRRPGMMQAMHGLEPAERQVGVDLRGRDVGVPEQGLNSPQVSPVLNHVGGATVAQAVRAGLGVEVLDQAPDPLAGKNGAALREKERAAARALGQLRTAL